ncbi:MAG: hypothetical protein WEB06_13695 [Actinomycetota bacterium]
MRRHRLDPLSLVFGAAFAILGGLFLFAQTGIEDLHAKWLWPVPLIVMGGLMILLSIREERSRRGTRGDEEPLP